MRRLKLPDSTKVRIGLAILGFFIVVAIIGPTVVTHVMHLSATDLDTDHLREAPSADHWLGTDANGRDLLARLVLGTRTSLLIGLLAGLIATSLATVIGITGAYVGGRFDALVTACTNVFLVLPGLPLLIIVGSYVKGRGGWWVTALIIGLTGWAAGARQKRAQALSLRGRDFVTATELIGESRWRVVVSELVPHLAPLIAASLLFSVVGAIFAEAGLAFIGAGNPSLITWGMLINLAGPNALFNGEWYTFVPPAACIAALGTAAGLINFGIDEISNPRLRVAGRRGQRLIPVGGGRNG
ncbi:ABC transporter permease [Kribbella sp. GL6]|uniref:ABC transporter permease n=1 Tax=Kribbella sp. GL6 TaxID=3419765 RepID=UPI003D039412